MRVACLHTAESNVEIFDAAAERLGLAPSALVHEIRADLLSAVEIAHALRPDIERQTVDALLRLSGRADAVLLTCSTLGSCVSAASAVTRVCLHSMKCVYILSFARASQDDSNVIER